MSQLRCATSILQPLSIFKRLMEEKLILKKIRDSEATTNFAGGKEIIEDYKNNNFPAEHFTTLLNFLEAWGDYLSGSNKVAGLLKYKLALEVLHKYASPGSASELYYTQDTAKRLADKIEGCR